MCDGGGHVWLGACSTGCAWQGDVWPGGHAWQRGVRDGAHAWRGGGGGMRGRRDGHCSGRYASYLNAFLMNLYLERMGKPKQGFSLCNLITAVIYWARLQTRVLT